jgi:hypothetical protein
MKGSSNNNETQPKTKICGRFTVSTQPIPDNYTKVDIEQMRNLSKIVPINTNELAEQNQKSGFWASKIGEEKQDLKQKPLSR